jgi:hypothetical protein
MTLKSYIGFSTSKTSKQTVTESSDPTVISNIPFGGVFNMSLEDYYENSNVPYIKGSIQNSSGGVSVSSLAVNVPTNNVGDLLITFLCGDISTRTFSSSGWTLESESIVTPSFSVLSKVSSGSEPSSYTFNAAGGTVKISGVMVSVSRFKSYTVGSFGAQSGSPVVSVPDDSSDKKLILFAYSNNGSARSWNINNISEYELQLINDPSLDVSAIYRTSQNTSLVYTATQSGAGSNSYGISVVVK